MKTIIALLGSLLLMSSSSFAVVYHAVTFSATVYFTNSQTGAVSHVVVNNHTLTQTVATSNNGTVASDYAVVIIEGNGTVSVIRKDTGAVMVNVVSNTNNLGNVDNNGNTDHYISTAVTIAIPQGSFSGAAFAHTKTDGSKLNSANISFSGGANTVVCKGSCVTTAKRYSF